MKLTMPTLSMPSMPSMPTMPKVDMPSMNNPYVKLLLDTLAFSAGAAVEAYVATDPSPVEAVKLGLGAVGVFNLAKHAVALRPEAKAKAPAAAAAIPAANAAANAAPVVDAAAANLPEVVIAADAPVSEDKPAAPRSKSPARTRVVRK